MKNLLLLLLLFSVTISWSQSYQSAESVEYDAANDRWLVANGSRMLVDDGAGNLSFFGTGNATHGTEVLGNTVFTIANNRIKGYDLTSELLVMDLQIPGVSFLNGMTNDGGNTLYVTDFSASKIYSIDVSDLGNPSFVEIVSNTSDTPNGILYDGSNNRLLYVTWGSNAKIKAIDLGTFMISTILDTGLTNLDGIVNSGNQYFVSSWAPARITEYNDDFTLNAIVDTPALNSPADIGIDDGSIIGIPMGTSVIFVTYIVLGVDDVTSNPLQYVVSSNPVNDASFIQFNLQEVTDVSLTIYDSAGKLVSVLLEEENVSGRHTVLLAGLNLTGGLYFSKLSTDRGDFTQKLIVK